MRFQQVIAGKVKLSGLDGIRRHLIERQRVKTNPNIDLSRSHLNHCIENLSPDHLTRRVNTRISQLHLKKKPRSDAVGIEDIIISASADFMLSLDPDTREQYFCDSLHFLQNRYGKENVMYCQCHMDESNPHIHVGIIPVTPDGRLSAKSLFNPKTLEQLQTDFHDYVSKHYGLERGESHAKRYLPLQQFKANQARCAAKKFADDVNTAIFNQQKLADAEDSAHFATSGLIFTSEDKNTIQIPTTCFLFLKQLAEDSIKLATTFNALNDEIQKLRHDNSIAQSDLQYTLRELEKLRKSTELYATIPHIWRSHIDDNITQLQKNFTDYCHEVNRATVRIFIATHGNLDKTVDIMRVPLKKAGISDVKLHISNVIHAAKKQHRNNLQPPQQIPSWKPPKPSETNYSLPCHPQCLGTDAKLADLSFDTIDWDLINWNLLSVFDKADINRQKMIREL